MSERKLLRKAGRHLRIVRPRPFVPPPPLAQFWQMLRSPSAGVALVLRSRPGLSRIIRGLIAVGVLRALTEGLWLYLSSGRMGEFLSLLGRWDWYSRYGGPFLLSHLSAAGLLWITVTLLLHLGGRVLGASGTIRQALPVTGMALYSLALGYPFALLWMPGILYQTARQVYGLPPGGAALAGVLPVLAVLLAWLGSAGHLLHLVPWLPPGDWRPVDWLAIVPNG